MKFGGIVEIPYASDRHKQILQALNARLDFSRLRMSDFHDKWRRAEEAELAYMQPSDMDQLRKGLRDAGSPQYTTLVVPYNYALLQAAHTYWTSVFLGRSPVFQYQGRHGEAELQVQAIECIMDYQYLVGKWQAPLYIWLHDVAKYGVGVVWHFWDEEYSNVTKFVDKPKTFMGIPIPGSSERVRETSKVMGYQGNRLFNVRPYDFFPDPRVPVWDFQKGEFVGRIYDSGWNELIAGERDGRYYNLKDVWVNAQRDSDRDAGSSQLQMPFDYLHAASYALDDFDKGYNEMLDMIVELVPFDWDLGSSKTPEKWAFTVANRGVIVSCQPLGYDHNKFPADVLQYEIEGYQVLTRSMYEVMQPLNDTLTWLVNAHLYNVRSALNDQFVVDPSRIEWRDVTTPGPGRLWRMKPTAYGTDPKTAYSQFQSHDVTQAHLQDVPRVIDLLQRTTGVMDQLQGAPLPSGRRSATESRISTTMGANRLKTNCEWFSAIGFGPLSEKLLQVTQQLYTKERKFRIVGDMATEQLARMITPEDIQGFYDFIPVDGSMPVDKMANAQVWKELMGELRQFPELLAQYDIGKIFDYVAQLAGIRSIKQFKVQVMSPEQIAMASAAGKLIPIPGGKGGQGNPGAGGRAVGAGGGAGPIARPPSPM
jgi:hypothetical protein